MCTLTWIKRKDQYDIFFNRDELLTRGPEMPPEVLQERGLRLIAPRDSQAGGTWIGVNEAGITLALMNDYSVMLPKPAEPYVSRGLLLYSLLSCETYAFIHDALNSDHLTRYAPFRIAFFSIGDSVVVFSWDGTKLHVTEATDQTMPLVSSSVDQAGVTKKRREYFHQLLKASGTAPDERLLVQYHNSEKPEPGPYAVCMRRQEAATRSFSRITVYPNRALFYYHGAPPAISPDQSKPLILKFERKKRKWNAS